MFFFSLVSTPCVLKVSDIASPCLLMAFPVDEKMYVGDLPNPIERD